ncbi:MAG: thiamine-phosphate kinase [Dehalococcoidales bacterium]|nr:thiamine-phosphate kinase [Dehalococcoidales bacterium]
MNISELGEFGLIDLIREMVDSTMGDDSPVMRNLILGIGDDAAVWQGDSSVQLATSDTLVQDIHFNLNFISWEDLGWKAMAANLSDIAAMGGSPRYALVSLSLPGSTEIDSVTSLYRGMIELANKYDTVIVGGNISSAPLVIINITLLGNTDKEKYILKRSSARISDKIAVTGHLGASGAGLKILRNIKLNSESEEILKQAFLRPNPRIKEGQLLVEKGVRSAIDISDGLIADLGHICKASQVGACIEASRIPVHPVVMSSFGKESLGLALSGGEDYELLFTAPLEIITRVKDTISCPVTVIGEIIGENEGEVLVIDDKGNRLSPESTGWQHFNRSINKYE